MEPWKIKVLKVFPFYLILLYHPEHIKMNKKFGYLNYGYHFYSIHFFMHPLKSIGQILSLEQTFGVSLS